jgi:hypothetical protein
MDNRIVKVPLPVELIRKMDEALAEGRGGLETRAAFIKEAAENLLAEVTYPDAPPERATSAAASEGTDVPKPPRFPVEGKHQPGILPADILKRIPSWEMDELRLADLAGTALTNVAPGATLEAGVAEPDGEPLLGLHNRDYPSIWAAHRLARYTEKGVVPFEEFRARVTDAAWVYSEQLGELEDQYPGIRLRSLFPSNPLKRESAERAFQTFAVGSIPRKPSADGPIKAGGPLFVWKISQLIWEDGTLMIGLTSSGREFLERLSGVSLEIPHNEQLAQAFLDHLIDESAGERWGFDQIIRAVATDPDREKLVSIIARARSDWTKTTASSVAQGYVARAREWGLLELRLVGGRYSLTDFGRKLQGYMSVNPDGLNNREGQS